MNFKDVKTWIVGSDGRAVAKTLNSAKNIGGTWVIPGKKSREEFEHWRLNPDNQPFTDAEPGEYDSDRFEESRLQRYSEIEGGWTDAIKNKAGYKYRLYMPLKKEVKDILKVRKRVFELQAVLLENTPKSIANCQEFIEGKPLDNKKGIAGHKWHGYLNIVSQQGGIYFKTLESDGQTQKADFGDYIIKGIKGEFYPCKPEIFKELYEII